MTEEPYRWLEAIQNRREYIEDQLAPGLPSSRSAEPGVLFLTIKTSTPGAFRDLRSSCARGVGHPADIEKVRQTVIDAAHVDGFTRSPGDVSAAARRLQPCARAQGRLRAGNFCPRRFFSAAFWRNLAPRQLTMRSGASITMAPSRPKMEMNSRTAWSSAVRARWGRIGSRKRRNRRWIAAR